MSLRSHSPSIENVRSDDCDAEVDGNSASAIRVLLDVTGVGACGVEDDREENAAEPGDCKLNDDAFILTCVGIPSDKMSVLGENCMFIPFAGRDAVNGGNFGAEGSVAVRNEKSAVTFLGVTAAYVGREEIGVLSVNAAGCDLSTEDLEIAVFICAESAFVEEALPEKSNVNILGSVERPGVNEDCCLSGCHEVFS
jgi:hypothetical protein